MPKIPTRFEVPKPPERTVASGEPIEIWGCLVTEEGKSLPENQDLYLYVDGERVNHGYSAPSMCRDYPIFETRIEEPGEHTVYMRYSGTKLLGEETKYEPCETPKWKVLVTGPVPDINLNFPSKLCTETIGTGEVVVKNNGDETGDGFVEINGSRTDIYLEPGERRKIEHTFSMGKSAKTIEARLKLDNTMDTSSTTVDPKMPTVRLSVPSKQVWIVPRNTVSINPEVALSQCPSTVRTVLETDAGRILDEKSIALSAGASRTVPLSFEMPANIINARVVTYIGGEMVETSDLIKFYPAKTMFVDSTQGIRIYGSKDGTISYTVLVAASNVKGEELEGTDKVLGLRKAYLWQGTLEPKGIDEISFNNMSGLRAELSKEMFIIDDGTKKGKKEAYQSFRLPLLPNLKGLFFGYLPK